MICKRYIDWLSLVHPQLVGDLTHKPGMCPDRKSNWWPFGSQAGTQSTEPGLHFYYFFLKLFFCCSITVACIFSPLLPSSIIFFNDTAELKNDAVRFCGQQIYLKKNYEPRNKLLTYWSAQRKDQVENEVKVTDLII